MVFEFVLIFGLDITIIGEFIVIELSLEVVDSVAVFILGNKNERFRPVFLFHSHIYLVKVIAIDTIFGHPLNPFPFIYIRHILVDFRA